jgi:hypothetical protein
VDLKAARNQRRVQAPLEVEAAAASQLQVQDKKSLIVKTLKS